MGFYGNLTNTARTQFQFDRIYPNRYSMESSILTDGVYIGRYVLVEYDADMHESTIKIAYLSDNQFFTTIDLNQHYLLNTYSAVARGIVNGTNFSQYYTEENGLHYPATGYDAETVYYSLETGSATAGIELDEIIQTRNIRGDLTGQFWKCIGVDNFGYAKFEDITESSENNYLINYNIDVTYFGPRPPEGAYSRAWDSTVWQKIYAEGEVKYIMIAELNTAAPSFSIAFDAPTQTPLAPHVDASSNNNVYRVHLQPSWGFRVKEEIKEDESDIDVYHINSVFDSKANRVNQFRTKVPGAIYWNGKGFMVDVSTHSSSNENYILLEPTGRSNLEYNVHKGYVYTKDTVYQEDKTYYRYNEDLNEYTEVTTINLIGTDIEEELYEYKELENYDINEFVFHLPAIGNAVADFYDLMYDVNANNRDRRYRDTAWKYYSVDGQQGPDSSIGGMTRNLSTLAGSINYLHDLEGMIIYLISDIPQEDEIQLLSSDFIYGLKRDDSNRITNYYYRAQTYKFDSSNVNYSFIKITDEDYIPNCYFTMPKDVPILGNEEDLSSDLNQNGYQNTKDYYKRILGESIYKEVGELLDYNPGIFYYQMGANYLHDFNDNFDKERTYYLTELVDRRWRVVSLNEPVEPYREYYFNLRNLDFDNAANEELLERYNHSGLVPLGWYDTQDTTFQEGKEYYIFYGRSYERFYNYQVGDDIPVDIRIIEVIPRTGDMTIEDILSPSELAEWSGVNILTEDGIDFKTSYQADEFYYLEETGTVQPEINGPEYPIYDYILDHNNMFTTDVTYYSQTPYDITSNVSFYYPNAYFYFDNDNGIDDPFDLDAEGPDGNAPGNLAHLDDADYPTQGRYYWNIELSAPQWVYTIDGQWTYIQTILGWNRVNNLRSITDQWIIYNAETTLNELFPETPNFRYFYKINEDDDIYHMIHINNRNTVCSNKVYRFYEFPFNENDWSTLTSYSNSDFYVGGKYYYYNDREDILLDQNAILTIGRNYFEYEISQNGVLVGMEKVKFYEPEYYYYRVGNNYALDINEHTTDHQIYYEKDVYRVVSDLLGIYSPGAAWNTKCTMVPCTVTLGVAEPWYELREIGDISSGTNSINNIILKYNKMLADGERLVRSNTSVQGTLNLYKDTLQKIEQDMEPNKLITSDYYGRMTTTDYSINDLLNRISELESRIQALES